MATKKKKAKQVELVKDADFPKYWLKDWVVAVDEGSTLVTYRLVIERTHSDDIDTDASVDQVRLYRQQMDEFGCTYWTLEEYLEEYAADSGDQMSMLIEVMARIISEEVPWD